MDIDAGRRSNKLQELLALHDELFVRMAYKLILAREADKNGLTHFVSRIRNGDDRVSVLASLRYSPEGQISGIFYPELDTVIKPYRRSLHPVWGKVLRKLRLAKRLKRHERRINRLENQLARASAGESLTQPAPSRQAALASLPSRKVTGNVAVAAHAWSERPLIRRIAVLKLDHFGDFFVSVRAFSRLREAWPDAYITLVCGSWNVAVAERLGLFNEILAFDMPLMLHQKAKEKRSWLDECEGIKALQLRQYDLAVDLRHDFDTRPCLLHVEAPYKAGYEDGVTRPWPGGVSPINIALHQTELHAELRCTLLAQLVVDVLRPPDSHPIRALARARVSETSLPFADGTYLVVAPGAAARNRTWPAQRFGELLRMIRVDKAFPVVLVGTDGDRPAAATIAKFLPDGASIDLCGAPFEDLPWVFANAAMFIGCDSGPGHLAALLGTRTLSVYAGVSSPHIWQPLGPRVRIVHSQTPCAYCYDRECAYGYRCTDEISVRDVFQQYRKLISAVDQVQEPNYV